MRNTVTFVGWIVSAMTIAAPSSEVLFRSDSYTIYSDSVRDDGPYDATSYSTDGISIYSLLPPPPYKGDPSACYVEGTWTPETDGVDREKLSMYPSLHSGHKIIDAVYNNAMTIFYRSTHNPDWDRGGRIAGMWQAGYRQCEGYDVWRRDAVYCALLMGNLYDPVGARKTLKYITTNGVNNGEDGWILPSVGLWDYYVATGDKTLIDEVYQINKQQNVAHIQYDDRKHICHAPNLTFVDSQSSGECEGFAFSTNVTVREAFRALALMGELAGESESQIEQWRRRGEEMKVALNDLFWNPDAGYYTPGPRGTKGYNEKYWENWGQSMAIWPRFDVADAEKRRSVLHNKDVAWTEWGFMERYYKSGPCAINTRCMNMHDRVVWPFTMIGEAVACAREQDSELLFHIFCAILRDAAMNKTFMELIGGDAGHGNRYPGQLWHALGWVSIIYYAMLGMEYDESGLRFDHPCVPEPLKDMRISSFRYREGVFDIQVKGFGSHGDLRMDGSSVDVIPTDISGHHTLELLFDDGTSANPGPRRGQADREAETFHVAAVNPGEYRIVVEREAAHTVYVHTPHGRTLRSWRGRGPKTYRLAPETVPAGVFLVSVCAQGRTHTLRLNNVHELSRG